jgi:hypothetical protein
MVVNKNTEYYLIHSMGLNKKQIKDMTPGQVDEHCNRIIRQRLDEQNVFTGNGNKERKS